MSFQELKAKQSVIWGAGPYERVSAHLASAHAHLISEVTPRENERWLDVATGTGAIALRAADLGADVTAQDLSPELIETARRHAAVAGVPVDFQTGDCESLPYEDGAFDTVSSTFGHMFSPDHEASAAELARVCRPGGRIALLTWHQLEGVAELFKLMAPYQMARPAGVGYPFDWGDHEYVQQRLGDAFELTFIGGVSTHREPSAARLWQVFEEAYGPTKVLAESLGDERREELRRDCIEFFDQFDDGDGVAWRRPYLLTVGTRKS